MEGIGRGLFEVLSSELTGRMHALRITSDYRYMTTMVLILTEFYENKNIHRTAYSSPNVKGDCTKQDGAGVTRRLSRVRE